MFVKTFGEPWLLAGFSTVHESGGVNRGQTEFSTRASSEKLYVSRARFSDSNSECRNILIVGAGAIGSLYAAHLARVADVWVFVRREEHARIINERGIRVTGRNEFHARLEGHHRSARAAGSSTSASSPPRPARRARPSRRSRICFRMAPCCRRRMAWAAKKFWPS